MHLQLAWRNIWRNPRRTAVIMTAIVIGVWMMIFSSAIMRGNVEGMVENSISTLTGDIQIHQQGYRSDPVVENSMTQPDEVKAALERTLPADAKWAMRVRVNAVASNARHSTGLVLVGIEPSREPDISFIGPQVISEGKYLDADDEHGIIVGKALVDKFETKLGHKLVLMSQDTAGEIASRSFRIVGIYRAEMEGTEKQFAFVTMPAAQQMLKLGDSISEVSISLTDHYGAEGVADAIRTSLPETYEIHAWRELLPIVDAMMKILNGFLWIWYVGIFIAMGFGIVNTTLMAVFERMREFGLLKALGTKPWWIIRDVITESFLLLIMGTVLGNVLGFLSSRALSGGIDLTAMAAGTEFFGMPRIIYPVIASTDVILANAVVIVLGLLVSVYPAVRAARFTPVEALART
jgi:ABC-type lipoprotein release transport system permease subunit